MQAALKLNTVVLPGHRIEVATPDIPEGANVELIVYRLPDTEPSLPEQEGKIPAVGLDAVALNTEYEVLVQTQWQRNLTEKEQARLGAIKAEMNALDEASDARLFLDRQIANIHRQLAAIRQEVESLPDAS
jgi:hypothetical protein